MSALFLKISLPSNVERYRHLRTVAKARGFSLVVHNVSRMRGVPMFLFYLDRNDGKAAEHFSALEDAAVAIGVLP